MVSSSLLATNLPPIGQISLKPFGGVFQTGDHCRRFLRIVGLAAAQGPEQNQEFAVFDGIAG